MPTVVWKGKSSLFTAGVNTTLVEQPDSPQYVLGEKAVCVRKFKGLHSLCISSAVGRGTLGTGSMSGWMVSKCTINRLPKQIGELVIEYEAFASGSGGPGGSLVLPPDEFDLNPFEINPRIERNPYFNDLDSDMRKKVEIAVQSRKSLGSPEYDALNALGLILAAKITKGIETYYKVGWTYTWTTYSWDEPASVDGGGYIDSPAGPLSSLLSGASGYDWLRQADVLTNNGSYYKLTQSWMGANDGHWDTDLY